jgi:hypothetical protein
MLNPVQQARLSMCVFHRTLWVGILTFPVSYSLYYMGSYNNECYQHPQEFFDSFQGRRMFVVFMCTQMLLTRVPMLVCVSRVMNLASATPLQKWASRSRIKWVIVTGSFALLCDLSVGIFLGLRKDACDYDPDYYKGDTMDPLCRHSSQVSLLMFVFYFLSTALTVGLFVSTAVWYSQLASLKIKSR